MFLRVSADTSPAIWLACTLLIARAAHSRRGPKIQALNYSALSHLFFRGFANGVIAMSQTASPSGFPAVLKHPARTMILVNLLHRTSMKGRLKFIFVRARSHPAACVVTSSANLANCSACIFLACCDLIYISPLHLGVIAIATPYSS